MRSKLNSLLFLIICFRAKTLSVQERSFLNPDWFSSKIASVIVCRPVFNIFVCILYPHKCCIPFLNSEITWASYQVLGILATLLTKFRTVLLRYPPLNLLSSALIPSGPVAFIFFHFF
jgi:hypothetical protein